MSQALRIAYGTFADSVPPDFAIYLPPKISIYFISFVNCKQRYSHKFSFLHSTFPSQAVYFTKLGQEL